MGWFTQAQKLYHSSRKKEPEHVSVHYFSCFAEFQLQLRGPGYNRVLLLLGDHII